MNDAEFLDAVDEETEERLPWFEVAPGAASAVVSLTHTNCHWPLGNPHGPDFCYCAEPVAPDAQWPYCGMHMKRAMGPPRRPLRLRLARL